jgi:hypothetical protein
MSKYKRAAGVLVGLAAAGATVAALAPAATAHPANSTGQKGPVVVVSGLNNPRQLSLVNGKLYIAEAGRGGKVEITGPEGPSYIGNTGSISKVTYPWARHDTSPHRIVTGLLSTASQDGSFAVGSDGVSVTRHGSIFIQITYAGPTKTLPTSVHRRQNGRLLLTRAGGPLLRVANISAFENTDPDHMGFDSDPYAVLVTRHGVLVADAAANDVLRVDRYGRIHVFHVFHNVTSGACATQQDPPGFPGCNFVPTSLAQDRWGNIYVGGLGSLVPGEGRVVKLDPTGRHVLHVWTGFTSVTGVAVGHDGTLYVSQFDAQEANPINPQAAGVVTKINCSGDRTNVDVPFPAGIVVDGWGNVYVSAFSIAPSDGLGVPTIDTSGQVWRLRI